MIKLPEIDATNPDLELAEYLFDLNGFLIIRNAVPTCRHCGDESMGR
ncbi:MAG: hypothetical protein MK193_10590 [Lentisphaeria bacterium]|nr:hypothetical protein [Lentisphaeria bacterium]